MCIAWEYFKKWAIAKGERKGFQKGLKEGREEGRKQSQKQVAIKALRLDLDYGTIKKLTGFSKDEIEKIAASLRVQTSVSRN